MNNLQFKFLREINFSTFRVNNKNSCYVLLALELTDLVIWYIRSPNIAGNYQNSNFDSLKSTNLISQILAEKFLKTIL